MIQTFLYGFLVGGSLIVAIGAQNAFVLKQGLLKQHIFWVCLICFLCDVLLISFSVFGLTDFISQNPLLSFILSLLGFIFLTIYGFNSFLSAYHNKSSLHLSDTRPLNSLNKTLIHVLAITLLNPHVYLDTIVIIGGFATTLNQSEKYLFLLGAIFASCIWFFSLGFGARLLIPLFNKPKTWQILDVCIGVIMWAIAFGLLKYLYQIIITTDLL